VLVLVLATLAAVGYLYLARGGSRASATGFLGANQQSIEATDTVITAAGRVQRFAELHAFDLTATTQRRVLAQQLTKLEGIAASASGPQKQIADQSVTTVKEVIFGVDLYRKAVASTYRLVDADQARRGFDYAVASLQRQAQAWRHS
jgi:hypothetical protein